MKISEIIKAIAPKYVLGYSDECEINYLLTDSREQIHNADQTLFFALRTDKNNGAKYIPSLIEKAVKTFVVDEQSVHLIPNCLTEGIVCLVVEDSLVALQALAAYKRSLYKGIVIGITGSNGKTVVKEWLYQLLKDDYTIVRSPKSYNSQIGVPLSVWQLQEDITLAIFEAGISKMGEMERLEPMIRPTIGVVTYIGSEHGENFCSLEQKREQKMKLFINTPTIIEDPTHQNIRTCAAVMRVLGYDEETIASRLLQQTHEAVLQINLSALKSNVTYFRQLLQPQTKLTCMVKAFAYGMGSVDVSRALQENGAVDYLAVAVADEGVELRRAGITLPIIVMDPEMAALDLILENNLEPNVYAFDILENILIAAKSKGLEHYPVHVKIDSGMHRLGFYREQLAELADVFNRQKTLKVKSVFSHLAGADEAEFDDFTREQIAYFDDCTNYLSSQLNYPFMRHILNSAGIERFAEYQMDMCRLGIGMYGISFNGKTLHNVCSLHATLLSVKMVKAGESIGYGRRTMLLDDRQIAVIPIGYADGLDRRLSNFNGEVYVRGKRCPIVGNICMDQAMIDVTDTDARVGDQAEIFGEHIPLQEVADKLQTIPYEILTSISRRIKRVYSAL